MTTFVAHTAAMGGNTQLRLGLEDEMPFAFLLFQTAKGEGGFRKARKFCIRILLGEQERETWS